MYDKTMDDGKDIGVVCRVCMYRGAVAPASRNAATTAQFYVLCGFRELQWQLHNIFVMVCCWCCCFMGNICCFGLLDGFCCEVSGGPGDATSAF